MRSTTKANLTKESIRDLLRSETDLEPVVSIRELDEGCYNASYALDCADGHRYVLKVAPPPHVEVLSYEKDIMRTEVAFMKAVPVSVPVPAILHVDFSRSALAQDWYLMEFVPGRPLNSFDAVSADSRRSLYTELARYYAAMHGVPGTIFGYPTYADRYAGLSYREVFMAMVEMVLEDGKRKHVDLPLPEKDFRRQLHSGLGAFDTIARPVLTHFDLWDGNLFVNGMGGDNGVPRITGIIDFERGFWGDPCADLCQVMGYIDLKKDQWFLEEYNRHASAPIRYGEDERVRTLLFRIYLFLIMIVESFYRDVDGSFDHQLAWSREELLSLLDQL